MMLQQQTTFGGAEATDAEKGNCFAACIASVLEVELATLPNFVLWNKQDDDDRWWLRTQQHLHDHHGVTLFYSASPVRDWLPEYVLTIASGPGPRGHRHCVVHDGGGMVHDPHPSGDGLLEVEAHDIFVLTDKGSAPLSAQQERLGENRG